MSNKKKSFSFETKENLSFQWSWMGENDDFMDWLCGFGKWWKMFIVHLAKSLYFVFHSRLFQIAFCEEFLDFEICIDGMTMSPVRIRLLYTKSIKLANNWIFTWLAMTIILIYVIGIVVQLSEWYQKQENKREWCEYVWVDENHRRRLLKIFIRALRVSVMLIVQFSHVLYTNLNRHSEENSNSTAKTFYDSLHKSSKIYKQMQSYVMVIWLNLDAFRNASSLTVFC